MNLFSIVVGCSRIAWTLHMMYCLYSNVVRRKCIVRTRNSTHKLIFFCERNNFFPPNWQKCVFLKMKSFVVVSKLRCLKVIFSILKWCHKYCLTEHRFLYSLHVSFANKALRDPNWWLHVIFSFFKTLIVPHRWFHRTFQFSSLWYSGKIL